MKASLLNILLIEDNEGDIELTKIAFSKGQLSSNLRVAHDGAEAVKCLSKQGEFQNAPRPDLILLDLNMPKMGGKEFLERVKQDAKTKSIPVIILTSSSATRDIQECYERHANCYIIKPPDLAAFIKMAGQVGDFWLNLAQLPHPGTLL